MRDYFSVCVSALPLSFTATSFFSLTFTFLLLDLYAVGLQIILGLDFLVIAYFADILGSLSTLNLQYEKLKRRGQ